MYSKLTVKTSSERHHTVQNSLKSYSHLLKKSFMKSFIFCAVLVELAPVSLALPPNIQLNIKPFYLVSLLITLGK